MFSWVLRHLERVYGEGWVTEAKNKNMYRVGDVEVDYITEDNQGLVWGLSIPKNTGLGLRRGITYITPEKGGDIWILRKCMHVPVFGEQS